MGVIRDAPFPEPVQPETLQVVDQIVTAGDAGKKVVDLRGALFAGRIKCVAHPRSLAAASGQGKAEKLLCGVQKTC